MNMNNTQNNIYSHISGILLTLHTIQQCHWLLLDFIFNLYVVWVPV